MASPIEEFTIWFPFGQYENLVVVTPQPLADSWDELAVQPEPVLKDNGFYDALILSSGIVVNHTVSGFSVSFDWLETGTPGSQFYEIINPVTFQTINSGWTVPEPTTVCLFGFGGLSLIRRKK